MFDWEMATIGDPLADLGDALSYWMQADDPPELVRGLGHVSLTVQPGFMTRDEFVAAYAKRATMMCPLFLFTLPLPTSNWL